MIKVYEGIVLRQTKIVGGRRMLLIFTRDEGKLSAGTHLSEKSKGGAALALRPFAYGQYTVSAKRAEIGSVTAAETLDAHFALGEDADRFAEASFVLEFTDRMLPDGVSEPEIFDLLKEYLGILARRKSDFRLLTISYLIKVMQVLGVFPDASSFAGEAASLAGSDLLSNLNGDILEAVSYIAEQPLKRMETLTLERGKEKAIFDAIRGFAYRHLELGPMKSEQLLNN